jgi:L-asparaginase
VKRLLVLGHTGGTSLELVLMRCSSIITKRGALGVDALVNAVPDVQSLAQLELEQIANVDSADLQFAHWCRLVERIREAFADDS